MTNGDRYSGGDSNTNLIINYVPPTITDDDFRAMFQNIGPLQSCKIIRDKATGTSQGFGFVEYVNAADAQHAIETLNGMQLQNKRLKVSQARDTSQGVKKGANLYIRNLSKDLEEEDLKQIFSELGFVISVRILTDQNSGISKGAGFVLFEKREHADSAIATYNGSTLPGFSEVVTVQYADVNKNKARATSQQMPHNGIPQGVAAYGAHPAPYGAPPARYGAPPAPYGAPPPYGPRGVARAPYGATPAPYRAPAPLAPYSAPPLDPYSAPPLDPYSAPPLDPYGAAPDPYGAPQATYGAAPGPMRNHGVAGGRHRFHPTNSSPGLVQEDGPHVLFVFNIDPEEDELSLWQLFGPHGKVQKVTVMKDLETKKGKGYAFVNMTNYDEAVDAINAINGYSHKGGKPLQVSFKKSKGSARM